jgi:radical SAM protein with 4Fe4S-binding SPASM domain
MRTAVVGAPRVAGTDGTAIDERFAHYRSSTGPTAEFGDLPETPAAIRNVGWTLGNACPYRCRHCYSMNARLRGRDMSVAMVDRIVDQLQLAGVETVNLGGNEPLFTNGGDPRKTLLPYIVHKLADAGLRVGLTTSGITIVRLHRDHPATLELLNDVDVSFDSPFEAEHNDNRGARIYGQAIEALRICQAYDLPRTCVMCAMRWNFSAAHVDALVALARRHQANVRINPIKPVQPRHLAMALPAATYYAGFARLSRLCHPVDVGEPPLAAITDAAPARRCPCGRSSFRIHSITPGGAIHVSPCVYVHDFKAGLDLLTHDLSDIIGSPQFRAFRQRHRHPRRVEGCGDCDLADRCGGGCAARSYLHHWLTRGTRTLLARDPYCPRDAGAPRPLPQRPLLESDQRLVHMDYLCTWIGKPIEEPSEEESDGGSQTDVHAPAPEASPEAPDPRAQRRRGDEVAELGASPA